ALRVLGGIDVAVILRFQGGVPRIETMYERALSRTALGMSVWPAEVDLMQDVADDIAAVLRIFVREFGFEALNALEEIFLSFGRGLKVAIFVFRHGCPRREIGRVLVQTH